MMLRAVVFALPMMSGDSGALQCQSARRHSAYQHVVAVALRVDLTRLVRQVVDFALDRAMAMSGVVACRIVEVAAIRSWCSRPATRSVANAGAKSRPSKDGDFPTSVNRHHEDIEIFPLIAPDVDGEELRRKAAGI